MKSWHIEEIQNLIRGTEMSLVLMALFRVAGAREGKAARVAGLIALTLKMHENEMCWKDIIIGSRVAVDVCNAIEEIKREG